MIHLIQKRIYFCKKTHFKGFITGFLFFCMYITSLGQSAGFADTVFTKRLNSLNLNIEFPYNDIVGDNIQLLTHQRISFSAKSLGIFFEKKKYIDSALKAAKLPKELQYLPLALSQTNTSAGFWQLPYIVAVKYGLEITDEIDERLDIKKSTSAVIAYLQKLSENYSNLWDIIIAYTNSAASLKSAKIRTNQSKDIWILYEQGNLPNKNIIPDFITYIYLANFYQSHHIKPVAPEKNEENSMIIYTKPVQTVVQTRPAPSENQPKTTTVPAKKEEKKTINYTVKSGDTLTKIAKKHNVTIANLQKWNNLKNDRINAGQKLIIYQ
jgi:membrane-bound lytic murein transglycosylase D